MSRTFLLNNQPWRFQPGDRAFVRNWSQESPVSVLEQLHGCGVPHYLVQDYLGGTWQISQLELSANPILSRDGRGRR